MRFPAGRLPGGWRAWPTVVGALVLLNQSLTFRNVWPTAKITWGATLSVELAACVVLLALIRGRVGGLLRRFLPVFWLALVVGHYLDVTVPALYGRSFDLYWDLPHLANVGDMFGRSAPVRALAFWGVAAVLLLTAAYALVRVALGWVIDAMARRPLRRSLAALAAAAIALFAVQRTAGGDRMTTTFADPVLLAGVGQVRSVATALAPDRAPAPGAQPPALASGLDGLGRADVLLLFVESYGAVAFDSPALAATLAPSRSAFEAAVRDTGRQVVSAYVESPTFGGSSWLAHLTLISGVHVGNQSSYHALMRQRRDTLVRTFARAGYRTVAVMPGTREAWPEGAFYGFDRIYDHDALEYHGPLFGWWDIPDQFTLAKLDAVERRPSPRKPLFAVFPTGTTHAPFGPVAPYQPDWSKVLGADAYDPAEIHRLFERMPDWTNLAEDYGRAMSYEFTAFAGYLRERAGDDLVLILLGDHQPVAAVSGESAAWTVPVHVVTGDTRIAQRLLDQGFQPGVTPVRPSLGPMHELMPVLVRAFSGAASTGRESRSP